MFNATRAGNDTIELTGRLDASQVEQARAAFDTVTDSILVSFSNLEYISSAGLGVLLAVQKRLSASGKKLTLVNLNGHVRDIFFYAGFDKIFEIR